MSAQSSASQVFVTSEDGQYIINETGEYLVYNSTTGEIHYTNNETPGAVGPQLDETMQRPSVSSFTDSATKCFLNLLIERKEKLRDTTVKKKTLWTEISVELKKNEYILDEHAVERKFRNMKHQFLQIKDNNTKMGRGRKSWGYYALMEELFENDTCVNPKPCMASMLPQKVANKDGEASTSTSELSGFDLIKRVHPHTLMLPESSSVSEVKNAVVKRRLNAKEAQSDSPTCKRVQKRGRQRSDENLLKIQEAIEDSNKIQKERNEILRELLNKFE